MIINLGIGLEKPPRIAGGNGQTDAENTDVAQPDQLENPGDQTEASTEADDENAQRPEMSRLDVSEEHDGNGEMETSEGYHQYLLARVVENFEERFPGEEGEEKIRQILNVLKEVIPQSPQSVGR